MPPEEGVRFELRLEPGSVAGARYAVTVVLPSGSFGGDAEILPPGEVRLEWRAGTSPPEWCVAAVRAQLRLILRDHKEGAYPRRVARWRPEPAGAAGRSE